MDIVDSHCHVARGWFEPLEMLLQQMDRTGVAQAVLIQINGQYDNSYQTECVRGHPDRFSSVVIVDTARPDAPAALERLAAQGASGVRLRANTRSPGDDPLAIWRTAAQLGLSVSCGGGTAQFVAPEFADVLQAFPDLPIVVEHLGSGNLPDGSETGPNPRQQIFELARFPNVQIKIHGLGEFAKRAMPVRDPFPFEQPIPPLLDLAVQAFGPNRVMWGSDYPPVSSREGYANALNLTMAAIANQPEAARAEIFGGTAQRVFPIRA